MNTPRAILASFALVAMLGACGSSPPCDELSGLKLPAQIAYPYDESATRNHIGALYGLTASEVTTWRVTGGLLASWKVGNREFSWASEDTKLDVRWSVSAPSLGRIMQCLGPPDRYQAERLPTPDGQPYHHLSLWYEGRALVAEVSNFGLPWGYTELQAIDRLVYVAGSTWKERLESAYPRGSFHVMRSVGSLRAWPGSLSGIVVGTDPWLP